jgi:glycosyltransferase involved in cell wall biosynthesis
MKIIVYSAMDARTVVESFGEPEYSYYFVLREFLPLLDSIGTVVSISDPAREVDPLYQAACASGENCIFLSFTPPHLTQTNLACPTFPVFAWEFSSMPTEAWWPEHPEHDWRYCLAKCAGAIVHSQQSAQCVRDIMGANFPVVAIPAPLWDRMSTMRSALKLSQGERRESLELSAGMVFDTRDTDKERWLPSDAETINMIAESYGKPLPASSNSKTTGGFIDITRRHAALWYQSVLAERIPNALQHKLDTWATWANPKAAGRRSVTLDGVIFTSVFNPLDGRKNWSDMLTGFCAEFEHEPDATLVLKLGHHRYSEAIEHMLLALKRLGDFKCRVVLLFGFLPDDSYVRLMQQTDFIVNTSHGEGQCLPLMEYLSCGKPAIAPYHSALADYIDENVAFVVDSWADAAAWPHDPRIAYRTLRQQLNWNSVCRAYRAAFDCYRLQPEDYQRRSTAAIERMHQHCSLEVARQRLTSLFAQAISPKLKETSP